MKVRKAIIPAAGLGTRVLPASKAVPKEMLNIVDKPAIQYIVEEAFDSGIEEILIITNRNKGAIEDHFDHNFELEAKLAANESKKDIYEDVLACSNFGNIYFLRQKETKGLGHAVLAQRTLSATSLLRCFTAMMLSSQKQSRAQSSFATLMKNTVKA